MVSGVLEHNRGVIFRVGPRIRALKAIDSQASMWEGFEWSAWYALETALIPRNSRSRPKPASIASAGEGCQG